MRNAWLVAAEAALAKHRSTFAVLPMGQLLRPDGLAAELGKRGYLAEAPGQAKRGDRARRGISGDLRTLNPARRSGPFGLSPPKTHSASTRIVEMSRPPFD